MNLPTLYKKSSTGAIQMWEIGAHPRDTQDERGPLVAGAIITHHGQIGGAIQTGTELIVKGKNVGKKNETSPLEQAKAEAQARWTKKKKSGYVESKEAAAVGEVDEIIEGGIPPMLSLNKSYPKDAEVLHKHLEYPCYFQPKLDGMKCVAVIVDGAATLWTRTRKRIKTAPHIIEALEERFAPQSLILDGEFYNHDYRDRFEDLMSLMRGDEPDADGEYLQAQYHVYDVIEAKQLADGGFVKMECSFETRLNALCSLMEGAAPPLFLVPTIRVTDFDHLKECYEAALEDKYEGGMAINADSPYESGKRSKHKLKMKEFVDQEFPIVGVEEGRGKNADAVGAFVCVTPDGKEFRATPKMNYADRKKYWNKPELWRGKQGTVEFKRWTNYGMPLSPRMKAVRDYE